MVVELLHFRPTLAALIAPALHGRGQLVGPAEGTDEQGHQNGHQGPGPLEDIAGFKVRAPGLLGGHDLVRLLNQRGDEPQGNGHHHGQLMDGQAQLFQRRQQTLQPVRQGDGAGGIGQQEGAHDEHHNAQDHVDGGAQTLLGDMAQQPACSQRRAAGEKQVHNGREGHDDVNGLQAPGQ